MNTTNPDRHTGRYYRTTRARSTGTLVTTGHADDLGLDPGSCDDGVEWTRWYNLCEAHGSIAGHASLALARSSAAVPREWCEECYHGEAPAYYDLDGVAS
jgi:hypothetical protein